MVKFSILLRRRAGMTHEEFVTYHREQHAPVFLSVPAVREHVRRYVQQHTIDAGIPGMPPVTFDGVTELWFDDVEALGKVFCDPTYLGLVRPDEAEFLDLERCEFIVSQENPVHEDQRSGS